MQPITPDDATEVQRSPSRPASAAHDAQFAPGTMVADRYRIVSLLGSGGMGEVYRADDVKLGQRVALKYIPPRIPLDRLYQEVRIGREISHPNVCRLHDIVEIGGQRFISMEYVDGEDLASLLRRIGRLPADKALALARDLCAGLAAAHERGFIHRDLKPANVMIDGRGNARITDFGLAVLADEGGRDFGGTPLYMAPEQLEHGAATVRSDIYALGLVLYEMFTGRRVFQAKTTPELRSAHSLEKTRPSTLVRELDPAVERAILRCLEEDPRNRPASVREVMVMLPGGDPLQAAIAAGQTPSPQLVAAAGPAGGIEPGRAWAMLVACLVLMLVAVLLREQGNVTSRIDEIKPADALVADARAVIRALGYDPRQADSNGRFVHDFPYRTGFARAYPDAKAIPAAAAPFLYRDAPSLLVPRNDFSIVGRDDPPQNVPGMTTVLLDAAGRLREFRRVPPARTPSSSPAVDWSPAFRAAGLDPARFREDQPQWSPPVGSDRRYAWRDADGLRVEAASLAGAKTWFVVLEPWTEPLAPAPVSRQHTLAIVMLLVLVTACILALRNVRAGSGDRRGARVVGLFAMAAIAASSLLTAHHVPAPALEWNLVLRIAGYAAFNGLFSWICYLAIEPQARRRWPRMLVGWTRVLSGRWRDPLVGTEVLTGLLLAGAGVAAGAGVRQFLERFASLPPVNALAETPAAHFGATLGILLDSTTTAVIYGFGWVTLLVLFRRLLRSDLVAWILVPLAIGLTAFTGERPLFSMAIAAGPILATWIALRFSGLLTAMASITFFLASNWTPFAFGADTPFAGRAVFILGAFAALAVYAFYLSLAGRPLFGSAMVEDEAAA
jgi:Protein kinase domain